MSPALMGIDSASSPYLASVDEARFMPRMRGQRAGGKGREMVAGYGGPQAMVTAGLGSVCCDEAARSRRRISLRFGVDRRISIAQDILLHLAHGVARQLLDHDYPFRHLEFGEPAVERLQHRGLIDLGVLVAHQDSGDALAEIRVRHADHGGFDHARHGVDLALDFLRVDVEAAGDHEILAAAENMHIAFAVDLAEIAGDEETVVAEFGFCLLGHPPVALEDVRALHFDHADGFARETIGMIEVK